MRRIQCLSLAAWISLMPAGASVADGSLPDAELPDRERAIQALEFLLGEQALELLLARGRRLKAISDRIRLEGAELCGKSVAPVWGMVVTARKELPVALHEPARARFRLDERIRIVWVMPGFPAEQAGLREGDVIHRINGRRIRDAREVREFSPESSQEGSIHLRVYRDESPLDLDIENSPGCYSPADLRTSDRLRAYANGKQIIVTTGFLRAFPDDNHLAVVLGHELAHNVLNHIETSGGPREEAEADYMGAYFAARAGYDVSDAVEIWQRLTRYSVYSTLRTSWSSHPSTPARIEAMRRTVAEIQEKLESDAAIKPESVR